MASLGVAVLREIAHDEVVAGFALQHLSEGVAADRGLNRVLHVGDIDLVAGGGVAVDGDVEVGLAEDAKDAQILDAFDLAHDADDLVGFLLQGFQVIAIDLGGEFALNAADGFFHVVFDGLGKSPEDAGNLVEFALHGGDQFFFVFVENRPPLISGFQIDEEFGIEKAGVIGAVIGTAHLAGALRNFGKRAEDDAGLIRDADAFVGAGAGGERAANPERAFIEMRQEFGADGAAESEIRCPRPRQQQADADRDRSGGEWPSADRIAIALD